MQVQGHFSLAGASLASPPLVRALRLQISAIHCRTLRGSPALRWQCPALRSATRRNNPCMLRQSAPCSRRLPPLRFGSPLLQAAICLRFKYDLAPLRFGRTQCASATPARYARCGSRRTQLPACASLMILPRYASAVRCARLESHRASLGVTLDAHSYPPTLHLLRPSHPNPHPLPLSPSHSPRGLTAPGRLTASCSRRLSSLRFARLLLQVAISPPFALIGGGPLN